MTSCVTPLTRPESVHIWRLYDWQLPVLTTCRPPPLRRGAAAAQPAIHPERREVDLVQYTTYVGGVRETLLLDQDTGGARSLCICAASCSCTCTVHVTFLGCEGYPGDCTLYSRPLLHCCLVVMSPAAPGCLVAMPTQNKMKGDQTKNGVWCLHGICILQACCTAPHLSCSSPAALLLIITMTPSSSCGCPLRPSTATQCHLMSDSNTLQQYRGSPCKALHMAAHPCQLNSSSTNSSRQAVHTSQLASMRLTMSHLPGLPAHMSDQAVLAVRCPCL
jgi:hypothetical protein